MSASKDRAGMRWDRAARYFKIARILVAHPDGIRAEHLAGQVGVSKRTVYRDLLAMEGDAGVPIWSDGGRWGLEPGAFLQPLALTLHEATTLFLAARMLAKASDEHDSELIGAFVKLAPGIEGLIHVSELSNQRVSRVGNVVSEGQEVQVKVLSIDAEKQRISLSLKAAQPASQVEEDSAPESESEESPARRVVAKQRGPLKGGTDGSSGGERFGLKW